MRLSVLVLVVACADDIPLPGGTVEPIGASSLWPTVATTSVDDEPIRLMVDQVVPLIGGVIAAGTTWVAASDPDADAVELVRIDDGSTRERLELDLGSAPTVVAWTTTEPELLHVILRGNSSLFVVEPEGAGVLVPICDTPRGLGWDAGRERMWVTCASGELVGTTADGTPLVSFWVEPDLRDIVVLDDGRGLVSRHKDAEVLLVDLVSGHVLDRFTPRDQPESSGSRPHLFVPRMLRRLVPGGPGRALAMYQAHDAAVIEMVSDGSEENFSYGGAPPVEEDPPPTCGGIVRTALSEVTPEWGFGEPTLIDTVDAYPVDLVDVGSDRPIVVTESSVALLLEPTLAGIDEPCVAATESVLGAGLTTGVVLVDDTLWVTTREPFFVGTLEAHDQTIPEGQFADKSGLRQFHSAPEGIACVSCHAEGGDDGHTWNFSTGARRTQSLGGLGISDTSPFHWNGDLSTFDDLFDDVGVERMGMESLSIQESVDLQAYLDRLPRPAVYGPPPDTDVLARGAQVFFESTVGCDDCHSGPSYSNGGYEDVGTGRRFQVPSLIGVGARLPLMHDGCAETIRERFDDPVCGGTIHGNTSHLSSDDIDALVVFLQTL